ncbi:sulfatase-like hydrolase/transferase [Alcaligenes sp. SDU_A2]|uniref:sulfatase-like hydrolase/transferase n=1 Tax=Alcaligenes sp. SDU_A2 TaxID=3136634 RepID=UPI00311F8F3E
MKKTLFIDFAVVTALAFFQHYLLQDHLNFIFLDDAGNYRWVPLALSIAPLFALYFLLRTLLPCLAAAAVAAGTTFLLTKINTTKQALTTAPLSWSDITRTDNFSVIPHYINLHHVIYIALVIVSIIALSRVDKTQRLKVTGLMLALLLGAVSLHPYFTGLNNRLSQHVKFELTRQDVNYVVWDWPVNIRKNGLLTHLIQTSQRRIPPLPTPHEQEQFSILSVQQTPALAAPSNIIIILCEACWHDEQHFKAAFQPLVQTGFKAFRGISPVYGGGTVNASFELLTGLPANGALNGIIYQEYTQLLAPNVQSWPRALEQAGYASISLHNHYRQFWNRDIINRKLGFRQFVSLEDMNYEGPIWANDNILFKSALERIGRGRLPHFQFITTVSTHGRYEPKNGDDGEGEYESKLTLAISEVADFSKKLLQHAPDSMILVVGDHKPGLTRFFHRERIFQDEHFFNTGSGNDDYLFKYSTPQSMLGDVPGYIYYKDRDLSELLNHQPFFCLTQILNEASIRIALPAFNYAQHQAICSPNTSLTYTQRSNSYPDWLYSASLF